MDSLLAKGWSRMNPKERYRFAFVSNSEEIGNTVKAYADPTTMDFEVHLATMEEALPVARDLLAAGVEVILGGGATGKLLRRQLEEPAVTIARTHLDIIRALKRAGVHGSPVGLTTFADPTDGLDELAEIARLEVREIVFNSTLELIEGIGRAVAQGVTCIVGGGVCRKIAGTLGREGVIILPGREAIQRAMQEAVSIATARRAQRRRAERLRVILESISEGVVGVNQEGRVDVLNPAAADRLGLDPKQAMGQPLPDVVKGAGLSQALREGRASLDQLRQLRGEEVVVSAAPILVGGQIAGAVATFKPAERIRSINRKLSEKLKAAGFVARHDLEQLVGSSREMEQVRQRARKYAPTGAALLIQGETGTGKEILAQAIHRLSPQAAQPFLAVNCSALPESLLESELFGYEEGAFTGAKRGGKPGLFELAQGGTLFLDEVADISPALQVRLLRALEEKTVMRVGGQRFIPVEVRVISSSYKDLAQESRRGYFRPDLYYRLAVLRLWLPPLRQRLGDIPAIAEHLMRRAGADPVLLGAEGLELLADHDWPGNVRELDALLKRFVLLATDHRDRQALLQQLMEEIRGEQELEPAVPPSAQSPTPQSLREAIESFEHQVIEQTLASCRFNRQEAARRLGISPNTLWRKLKT